MNLYANLAALKSAVTKKIQALATDESGATAIEYGLLAAFISVVIIATVTTIGTNLNGKFQSVANSLK